jgi:uncharacterized protein (TIGR00369 family)
MPECIQPENGKSYDHMDSSFVVMPRDTNHYGNVHGGIIVVAADNLAYAIAARFSRSNVVTARIGEWDFIHPVHAGDNVLLAADIVRVGHSSMDVRICVSGEVLKTGETFAVASALLTMVAVDEHGKPNPFVPRA